MLLSLASLRVYDGVTAFVPVDLRGAFRPTRTVANRAW